MSAPSMLADVSEPSTAATNARQESVETLDGTHATGIACIRTVALNRHRSTWTVAELRELVLLLFGCTSFQRSV